MSCKHRKSWPLPSNAESQVLRISIVKDHKILHLSFETLLKYTIPELLLRWSKLEPADKTDVGSSIWYIWQSSIAVIPNEPFVKDQRTSPADCYQ